MTVVYVARSTALTKWGADVGLGKNLFQLGVADDLEAAMAFLQTGLAGESDWALLESADAGELTEDALLEKLGKREKLVDPNFYPRLHGHRGIFKVKPENVENQIMMKHALDGFEPKAIKLKPADFAAYLIRNALR